MQVIRNAIKGAHRQSGSSYVALSQFTATGPRLRSRLKKRGIDVLMMSGFDGFIPEALLSILPPSLLFTVARKASQRSNDAMIALFDVPVAPPLNGDKAS